MNNGLVHWHRFENFFEIFNGAIVTMSIYHRPHNGTVVQIGNLVFVEVIYWMS